jgi:DNA gyrase subunit B
MPADPRPWIEVVCTELFAGGRFQRKRYGEGIGHGVGLVAVNALSEWLTIDTTRQQQRWQVRFERGAVTQGVTGTGAAEAKGTRVCFKPDPQIFDDTPLDYHVLGWHLQKESCLWPGVTCTLFDETTCRHETFHSRNGAADLVQARSGVLSPRDVIRVQGNFGSTALDCAIQQVSTAQHFCEVYVNGWHVSAGGTVVEGFRRGLFAAVHRHSRTIGLAVAEKLSPEHCLPSLFAVISVRLDRPHFEGPTRNKISNLELVEFTTRTVADGLEAYFREHPRSADSIIQAALAQSEK